MSIVNRIEKLRFLAQEIELAAFIARTQPTDYRRRAMARRVLVRVKDFAAHVAQLPKPLKATGLDPSELKERKEVYAKAFAEYYAKQRDRISAHVQDLDLVERLELWTDIEITKLQYFVDGAKEIYIESLGAVGVADYQPFVSFPEVSDQTFERVLAGHAASVPVTQGVTLDVGSFAASNPDTVTIIDGTPLQQRAAQLVTLQHWMEFATALYEQTASWANAERVIRAQLLTDAVSYADCLVTRVDAGPAQKMTGLDELVREAGGDASALDELVRVYRFHDKLKQLRAVRNVVGGHLDDDETESLGDLLTRLDAVPVREILRFYTKEHAAFALTCRRTFFMRQYLQSGVMLSGLVAAHGAQEHVRPFDPAAPARNVQPPPTRGDYSDDSLGRALDAAARGEPWGRDVLWDAFGAAPVVERCERDGRWFEYRRAHQLVLERLLACGTARDRAPLLALMRSCARGYPDPLAEVLVRAVSALGERGDHTSDAAIYSVLGELPLAHDGQVRALLGKAAREGGATAARAAAVALYRVAVHAAVRYQNWSTVLFAEHIQELLDARLAEERLLICLVIASLFQAGELHADEENAVREMSAIQPAIRAQLGDTTDAPNGEVLLTRHDYVGLAVWAALRFRRKGRDDEGRSILSAVVGGEILLPNHVDQRANPLVNLAVACLELGNQDAAKRVATHAMTVYPTNIALKLRCIKILLAAGVEPTICKEMLEYIRDAYVLDDQSQSQLEAIHASIR